MFEGAWQILLNRLIQVHINKRKANLRSEQVKLHKWKLLGDKDISVNCIDSEDTARKNTFSKTL